MSQLAHPTLSIHPATGNPGESDTQDRFFWVGGGGAERNHHTIERFDQPGTLISPKTKENYKISISKHLKIWGHSI
jgi:hypothetical protein